VRVKCIFVFNLTWIKKGFYKVIRFKLFRILFNSKSGFISVLLGQC